jgi:hypothetical protein
MTARTSPIAAASTFFYGPPDRRRPRAGRAESEHPSPQPERPPQPQQAREASAVRGTTYASSVEVGIPSREPASYRGVLARDMRAKAEASRTGRPPREGARNMKGTSRTFLIVLAMATILATVATGAAMAGNSPSGCTSNAPRASIDNTWAWGAPGSWGLPGQKLTYAIDVLNYDIGCGSSNFVVTLSAPDGFSVSMPSSTITLDSASSGYVWANVTSPATAADGNYPLTATVEGAGSSTSAGTSWYKVYSSDTAAPNIYWTNPSDGGALSGRSAYVGFASSDDHAVKKLDLSIDGVSVGSKLCDNVSYECQLSYKWSLRRVRGQHTATYTSTDWMGNVATQTVTFTVN